MKQQVKISKKQEISLSNYANPCQYLNHLNSVYVNYQNYMGAYSSCTSKIKLPWKKFKINIIPKYFGQVYANEQKQDLDLKVPKEQCQVDDTSDKLWKQHNNIISRYNKLKRQERIRPKTSKIMIRKKQQLKRNNIYLERTMNKLSNNGDNNQNSGVQQEVLRKLKDLKEGHHFIKSKFHKRISSVDKKMNFSVKNQQKSISNVKFLTNKSYQESNQYEVNNKVLQNEFIDCNDGQKMVVQYLKNIKRVDMSLSEKNIVKKTQILAKMKQIIEK